MIASERRWNFPRRHLVSPDGTIYYIRQIHKICKSQGIYIPIELTRRLGWADAQPLQIWQKDGVLLMKPLPEPALDRHVDTAEPKKWKDFNREQHISVFEGVK